MLRYSFFLRNLKHESHKQPGTLSFQPEQKAAFAVHTKSIPSIFNCFFGPKESFPLLRAKDMHRHLVLGILSKANTCQRLGDCWNSIKNKWLKLQNTDWETSMKLKHQNSTPLHRIKFTHLLILHLLLVNICLYLQQMCSVCVSEWMSVWECIMVEWVIDVSDEEYMCKGQQCSYTSSPPPNPQLWDPCIMSLSASCLWFVQWYVLHGGLQGNWITLPLPPLILVSFYTQLSQYK